MLKTIDLCGTWRIKGATADRGGLPDWPNPQPYMPDYPAEVPGTVQEALEFMTGDVHLAHNVYNATFIEGQFWLYTRHFTLAEDDLAAGRIRLVFEGLDLNAIIYVNGRQVGTHNNFYTPARIDITDVAVVGDNRVDVRLESGLYGATNKDVSMTHANPTQKMLRRVFCRKPQSSYEWDWSPRLINIGIFKPCRVEIAPVFMDETGIYHKLSKDYSTATINVRQYLNGCDADEHDVRVDATVVETGESASWSGGVKRFGCANMNITVQSPKLWYPRNHGEQFRYTVRVTLTDLRNGEILKVIEKKVGLRRVEIDQSVREDKGRNFKLIINGVQLFAKGGNMIPLDILFSRLTRDRYEVLIDRAVENNFNALRVWGGGVYETDDFFDLCDEKGIVVWQDFIGACATYPAYDEQFLATYIEEIRINIRRMSSYASLVIYAGNNEIDQSMGWIAADRLKMFTDASLYYVILPRVLCEEGDHHYYQPSSPWSPDGENPLAFHTGDQHPWAIGFENRDYFKYRDMDCRFPNEGGILGPTSLPNMMLALGPGQEYMYSMDFKVHDNSICDRTACAPEWMLKEKLGMEIKMGDMSIPDYVYYGGFLQGEGLTEYILNFRRRMNDTTSSAIFWMYNDCWPATRSWTTVDYLRNRTPAFWAVKRSFAPVTVDIVKTAPGFDVYGVNEWLEAKSGKLTYGYMLPSGTVECKTVDVTLVANNSCVLASLDAATLPAGAIPFAELAVDGEPLARRRWVDRPYNELGLEKTDIKVVRNADGTVTYLADKLVLGVCLDLDGDDGELSDNFFDLYPGRPYTVNPGSKSGDVLYSYMG